ncbi:MAG: aminomethyltransferase beta-barrel domain-containing protein, partial [Pararhizobium sp.]
RRGLGVSTGEPLYVVHLDARARQVVVGPREALETRTLELRDVNWLGDAPLGALPEGGFDCFAKVRSTRPPRPARLRVTDGRVRVDLLDGEAGVAPGQACVLYSDAGDEARVLGGGFIARSARAPEVEAMLAALAAPAAA